MNVTSRYEIEWKERPGAWDPDLQMSRAFYACVRGMPFGMVSLFGDAWIACVWDEKQKGFVQIGGLDKRYVTRAEAIEVVERKICDLIGVGDDPMTSAHPNVVHAHAALVELATMIVDGLSGSSKDGFFD